MMKRFMAAAIAACAAIGLNYTCAAKTIYVRCGLDDYTGHDGSSWELAYETIQDGIDKAGQSEGNVVLVHSGVYDKGVGRKANPTHWWGKSRIYFSGGKCNMTVRSCKGVGQEDVLDPEHTFIMGANDPDGENGFGDEAFRCIQAESSATAKSEWIIQGFTLKGGRTKTRTDSPGYGGALQNSTNGNDERYTVFLVDCTITDCQATIGSIALGGTLVRCKIADTDFVVPSTRAKSGVWLYSGTRFLNCLFTGLNRVDATTHKTGVTSGSGDGSIYFPSGGKFVNCTIMGNRAPFWNHSTTYWYNTLVSTSRWPTDDGAQRTNLFTDSLDKAVLIGPTLGDFRVRAGTDATTAGDAQYISDITIITNLPASIDRFVDIAGNPIPKTGAICVGCCQATVTPAAGKIYATDERIYFNNSTNAFGNNSIYNAYVWPTAFPTNYRVRAVANKDSGGTSETGYGITEFFAGGAACVPSWHSDDIYVSPSTNVNEAKAIQASRTSKIAYAKPGADETTADGSYEHPYPTLQQAYDKYACEQVIVRAFPGEYKTGGSTWGTYSQPVRLFLSAEGKVGVRVVAMEGPEKTFIIGEPDPDTGSNGPKATMLLATNNGRSNVAGFTLTGGYSGTTALNDTHYGKPIYSYSKDHLIFSDCIITNNHGARHGVGIANFQRCLIADNYGVTAILCSSRMDSCIFRDNHLSNANGIFCWDMGGNSNWQQLIYQSTVIGDGVHTLISVNYPTGTTFLNSIFDLGNGTVPAGGTKAGCVFNGFSDYAGAAGNAIGNPLLAADGKPFTQSPALTAAVSPSDYEILNARNVQTDFYGNPLTYVAGDKAYVGAIQQNTGAGVFISEGKGGIATSGAGLGYTAKEDFVDTTIVMAGGATRPVAGVVVNGETNVLDETHQSYTITAAQVAAGDVAVEPYYSNVWYVDAANGNDTANFGYNAGNAFKTLARACTNDYLLSGDTVMALPGTYREGVVSNATTKMPGRAYVKYGVTLASRDGAATTFICGEASETPAPYAEKSYSEAARAGLGPDAVRCVYIVDGGFVKGFTLTNGFTFGFSETGASEHGGFRTNGGGAAGDGTLEDCVFTGCKAFRGGGMKNTKAVRCVFDGCASLYGGGASSDAYQYGCISKNNTCAGNSFWGGFFYWRECENCTIFDALGGPMWDTLFLRNALVIGSLGSWDYVQKKYGAEDGHHFTNCVFAITSGMINDTYYQQCIRAGANCIITNIASLAVDADGRPVVGQNVAIDWGDASVSPKLTDVDLSGVQRIYNGALDCGALEADWRTTYAKDMGKSRVSVQYASPAIVETNKKVRMTADTEIRMTGNEKGAYIVKADVEGDGTLTVCLNGETVAELTSEKSQERFLLQDLSKNDITVTYAGDGYADIAQLSSRRGMCVVIR